MNKFNHLIKNIKKLLVSSPSLSFILVSLFFITKYEQLIKLVSRETGNK